jgi:DNA modification methylase
MSIAIRHGDCRDVLRTMPDHSVHCCVTSPPYFGLRDYGTAKWDGGDSRCDHLAGSDYQTKNDTNAGAIRGGPFKSHCGKCGATRIDSQIGLEATPDAFVVEMVSVFREVRRVLRDDGTLWLNLGDSYAGGGGYSPGSPSNQNGGSLSSRQDDGTGAKPAGIRVPHGLKPKDLIGIPWRVAFALRADGWYLRQDIIWSKPNPMPESVTDRCTKAHEYIFLLSKSARYYYDTAAIAEPTVYDQRLVRINSPKNIALGLKPTREYDHVLEGGRNKRSVWEVATQPFSEAHFATFPPALIEPCIKAGCPIGGTVLDPFAGAGTTGLVADRLQRSAILIELNPDYTAMSDRRLRDDAGLFAEVSS